MADEPEVVDGEVTGPDPELAPAVDEKLPTDIVIHDPSDGHELMRAMDAHDVQMLLEEIQSTALRKWVYEFPQDGKLKHGLTVHAVQDIVQRINWTGKAKIGVLPETLDVETVSQDVGKGEERFYVATIFARDEVTGMSQSGTSMEPHNMRLKNGKTKYDIFARTKAINKAERNAMAKFIPEEIEQTVIAMFAKDPSRVERIQTEAEAKLAELPAALEDEEATALLAQARAAYAEIVWPSARVEFPPAKFGAWVLHTQHSHESLRELVVMVEAERDRLAAKYGGAS